ncbi:MAG: 23S rRNA (adenine(2030)-N(6))-methyltransferase RlmJ [Alphaproteobacteria bacterium]|nr:23S rRNA (adenine(2030)-N(6))-methyltransferase RlmJ [Alphaproteobacteria bacterium]
MNYRHAFHAGNFADLVKHAGLLQLLKVLTATGAPLRVIDTHAGRGLYDLRGPEARKSGEAEAGIMRLMADPAAPAGFAPLIAAVRSLNGTGPVARYPGSPLLISGALRPTDSYAAYELRADEAAALREVLKGRKNVLARSGDGYEAAQSGAPPSGRVLMVIDPPFERADEYGRIIATAAAVRRRNRAAMLFVWLPLKDLATFDAFLGEFEDAIHGPALVFETRLRPLTDPMKMNGCALVLVGAPEEVADPIEQICRWTAVTLGEAGEARIYGA